MLICSLVALAVAVAGTAFALNRPAQHHHARVVRHIPTPSPSPTPPVDRSDSTAAPSNGHHMVSGPDEPTERHVIHTTGSVSVVSGNVVSGTNEHGAVGTPRPTP